MHHFIEGRRDETRQSNDVCLLSFCHFQDLVAGHHHAKINNLEVIALQNDTNNFLADVMHVTLDSGHHDLAIGTDLATFLVFNKRHQMTDGLLHYPGRLHDLRQKHFPVAKEIANDVHASHQWTFDNVERPVGRQTGLFSIVDYVFVDTVDEGMLESFLDRQLAPRQIPDLRDRTALVTSVIFGNCQQFFRAVYVSIEHHIFNGVA